METIQYKRSQFTTRLPVSYRYTASHAWLVPQPDGRWRVGLTKFATRLLGEMVDHGFQVESGAAVGLGQIIGWIEGFKAITDVYCVVAGLFVGANPALQQKPELVNEDPYGAGWLYEVAGTADSQCVDVIGYQGILDAAIDRMRERQGSESESP